MKKIQAEDFGGYWDSEKEIFVIYFPGNTDNIPIEVRIHENDDEYTWGCYLKKASYYRKTNVYECHYIKF